MNINGQKFSRGEFLKVIGIAVGTMFLNACSRLGVDVPKEQQKVESSVPTPTIEVVSFRPHLLYKVTIPTRKRFQVFNQPFQERIGFSQHGYDCWRRWAVLVKDIVHFTKLSDEKFRCILIHNLSDLVFYRIIIPIASVSPDIRKTPQKLTPGVAVQPYSCALSSGFADYIEKRFAGKVMLEGLYAVSV